MIADLPLALLRPTTCIRSTLVHTKALHLLTPRVIYLPHHCMAFIPPPPPLLLHCLPFVLLSTYYFLPFACSRVLSLAFSKLFLAAGTHLCCPVMPSFPMEIVVMAPMFLTGCSCESRCLWARLQLGADKCVLCCPWRAVACQGVIEYHQLTPELWLQLQSR